MNIFKPTTLTWKQLVSLKWGLLFIGIAIGAEWPRVFSSYALALVIIGVVLSVPFAVMWFKTR
jgi:hypothetical protein